MRIHASLLLALALSAPLPGQFPPPVIHPVGWRTVAWTNTGAGSPVLDATVFYPAVTAGASMAVKPQTGGWPVIVFLHGFGLLGSDYATLAQAWAETGFVVVLSDTAQWNYIGQAEDGHALHAAVVAANSEPGGPFLNRLDLTRTALAGHSMGGANVGNVLIDNPGYRCGLALAPLLPPGAALAQIDVPFGMLVGTGDWLTPAATEAQPYYLGVTGHGSFKFLRIFDDSVDHMNFVGLTAAAPELLGTTVACSLGFLRHCLHGDPHALDQVFGEVVVTDPETVSLLREVALPQLWLDAPLQIGTVGRVRIAVEAGGAALFAASSLIAPVPTPFGLLRIEPLSAFPVGFAFSDAFDRADVPVGVPADAGLIGLPVAFQAFGTVVGGEPILGSATLTSIEP